MHAFEPAELPFGFFANFRRQLRFLDLPAVQIDFFLQFVAFTQFLLDCFHLLPQIKLTLALVHFAARLRIDVVLDFENFGLLRHQLVRPAQAIDRVHQFENLLRFVDFQIEIRGDEVREPAGVIEG